MKQWLMVSAGDGLGWKENSTALEIIFIRAASAIQLYILEHTLLMLQAYLCS